jgi:predicted N-formylglutamate amidohydrolase
MFRKRGDGKTVELNAGSGYKNGLDIEERGKRLQDFWWGYWSGVRRMLDHWKKDNANPKNDVHPKTRYVFSMHTFNPVFEGERREIQIGILTTHFPVLAEYFQKGFTKAGYFAKINEPYNACHGPNQAGTAGCP